MLRAYGEWPDTVTGFATALRFGFERPTGDAWLTVFLAVVLQSFRSPILGVHGCLVFEVVVATYMSHDLFRSCLMFHTSNLPQF